ncbi:uncharacterized protein LOC142334586 isoform X2 [Convolutriloba macropyga]|uniref:uncharacterized protein LOC142334586 isoform X2 n=1 Tax=Convolutriloba macropyga TaxID=536237 RepID=UPI003F5281A3
MDFGSRMLEGSSSHYADETLDMTNRILDKIDQEMSQLNLHYGDYGSNARHDMSKSKIHGAGEGKTWMDRRSSGVGGGEGVGAETVLDSVSYVEDCLSTEKDVATFNDTVLSSIVDTEKFPSKPRSKRSKSALGRLNNHDKSIEAEELLRNLIEKRFPAHESPDSTPRHPEVPRINLDDETKFPSRELRGVGGQKPYDLGEKIRRRINGGSEVESVISRNMDSKMSALKNGFNFNSGGSFLGNYPAARDQDSILMTIGKTDGMSEFEPQVSSKRGKAPHQRLTKSTRSKAKLGAMSTSQQKPNDLVFPGTWFGDKLSVGSESTASFSMVFKEPPSSLAYMSNKPTTHLDKWQSFESLSSQSIALTPQGPRSRPVKKSNSFNNRSTSQPMENSKVRKNDRSASRFAEFVPRSYESSEVGSATEQEIEFIKAEAARIKAEMESSKNNFSSRGRNYRSLERRPSTSSLASTPRSFNGKQFHQPIRSSGSQMKSVENDVILKETERSMAKLKDLDLEVQAVLSKKQNANREMAELQQKKHALDQQISENEAQIRNQNVTMKNEQSALEILKEQKSEVERELERLKMEIQESKSNWNNQLDINTRQVSKLIEENSLLKESLQRGEITQFERYELQRQLEELREQMRQESAENRMKSHESSLELKEAEKRLRQYDETNRELIGRLEQLDTDYAEKVKKVNEINNFVKNELTETQTTLSQLAEEHENVKQKSSDQTEKLLEFEHVIADKETENGELKRINEQLQLEMHRLEQVHSESVESLETSLTREKTAAVDELNSRINELNKKYQSSLAELRNEMENLRKEKGKEVEHWKEKLNHQADATRELGEKLRLEAQEQVRAAVAQERNNAETERTFVLKRERDNFEDEMTRTVRRLQDAIDYEKKQLGQSHSQIAELKNELETLRVENRTLYKEATDANLVARESAMREHSSEISNLKERLEKEHTEKVFELEDQIRHLQDHLELTKVEHHNVTTRNNDLETRVVQHEKAILLELNEECRRICKMINVNYNRIRKKRAAVQDTAGEPSSTGNANSTGAVINSTTEAVINLKACVSELQTYVYELREALEGERLKGQQSRERNEICVRTLRDELNIETQRKMEDLKEKLHHAHMKELSKMQEAMIDQDLHEDLKELKKENSDLRAEMSKYKRDTAEKLAKQFEKEVSSMVENRLKSDSFVPRRHYAELERDNRRLNEQLECAKQDKQLLSGSVDNNSASLQLLRHLQNRVNSLKDENSRLKMTVSMNNSVQFVPPRAAPPSQ